MKIWANVAVVWVLYGFFNAGFTSSYVHEIGLKHEPSVTYNYDRIDEIKKACASVLSSASELKPNINRFYAMKEELFFLNGDWIQEADNFPIMPFDDSRSSETFAESKDPVNLVSFWVTDVDRSHQSKKSIKVNGYLVMGITTYGSFEENVYDGMPSFQILPSHSELTMSFQGIYTESQRNGGEKVMCLLGNAILPTREPDPKNPWKSFKGSGQNHEQWPLSEDDQILLVLRYPMTFTLTKRMISGELRSLNPKTNSKYFDAVRISSQLGKSATYNFGSTDLVSKACDPYPYPDKLMSGGISVYNGSRFCEILDEIIRGPPSIIAPNWKCNVSDELCSKLGPFVADKEINATDGAFKGVKLYMQNVKCELPVKHRSTDSARVSAVLRVVSPSENQYTASARSGVSDMTLAAEGTWKPSNGQLCMVGCLGFSNDAPHSCSSRICLYIPISFSIKQRSIMFGHVFRTLNDSSYFPLTFEKLVKPNELWNYFKSTRPFYVYSKINLAGTILEKNKAFSFRTVIKKSLLEFPKLDDAEAFEFSLSNLAEDLNFHVSGVHDPMPDSRAPKVELEMDILSVGPLFGHWYWQNGSVLQENLFRAKAEYTEKQLLINVSAQIMITEKAYNNYSVFFLEGLYDELVGKMYMVGCRDVRASWNVLYESMDLEAGLDCLIEVVISYPPKTSRWLINPTAKVSIASQRTTDDPLYFSPINVQTFAIVYRNQREDLLSHRGVEGILRILTLSMAIGYILSQLFYVKSDVGSLPYISVVMLGVQAIGYVIPLITGAEALFKKAASESYGRSSHYLENNQWFHILDYTVKLLLMVSIILTLRLCQKVWKSRIRLLTRAPSEQNRVPSDKWILLLTLTIHVIGYAVVLIIHGTKTSQQPSRFNNQFLVEENSQRLPEWQTELEEYMGLVEDLFLLPQIIGNLLWQIDCQPLRKLYFIGMTVVRLLPHIYDVVKAPILNPYAVEDYESVIVNRSFNFYTKAGDMVIPVVAIVFAVLLYVQQMWGYEKLSRHFKLLPRYSRMYERLPSKSFEAELASTSNGTNPNDKDHCDAGN